MSMMEKRITLAINLELAKESKTESVIEVYIHMVQLPLYRGEFEVECSQTLKTYVGDFTFNSDTDQVEIG
jgi:hypothetical protein